MKTGIAIVLLFIAGVLKAQGPYQYPFQDPSVSVEKRIDNLISLMTPEEKISCLSTNPAVPRLGVKGCGHIEGLHGVALGGPAKWGKNNPVTTTQFPQAIGLAETWDTALIKSVAAAEGYEARYIFQSPGYQRGALVIRAPNADLGRDPRWGRTEECYGEDPFFNGTMVSAFVKGLQGNDPRYWQAAALMKHFLANSNEEGRGHSSSDFDERLFREYYSVPFRMGIEAGARAFMASYNAYNGIPMMVNPVLRDIAIREWKQDGIICTDGGALRLLYTEHKYYPDSAWAAAMAVKAGINQFLDRFNGPIHKALNEGLLTEKDIENVIRGVFRIMIKLGLLDPPEMVPYAGIKDGQGPWLGDSHRKLALLATQKSIVLLKNDSSLLPLQREKIHSIAVVGPYANQVLLDWYSGTPPYAVTVPEGLKNRLGAAATVSFTTGNDPDSLATLVAKADYVIVVVGNHTTCNAGWAQCPLPSDGKEAVDRKSIQLEQETLVKTVYRLNPRTIVALISGFPYAITWTKHNIPAIVHLTHNSEELGNALADVLLGDYNPAGRLVQTWPLSVDQLPPMMDYNIRDGRTYMYFKGEALYPFGYGLSYTRFQYTHLTTAPMAGQSGTWVSVDIKNTGSRAGEEVVQLYVQYLHSTVQRPEKELKGFKRIALAAGETKTVRISLPNTLLTYWDTEKKKFVLEKDTIRLMAGSSSEDIRLETKLIITH